jgi:hypothetical protein
MVNISLTLYTKDFFGSFLKSPTQMGSLGINNSVTNISRLGTFNVLRLEVSVYNVYITDQFQTTFARGRGGGEVIRRL